MSSQIKKCQNCGVEFLIDGEDFTFYEKVKVPPPTWCPECRMMRRMTWRNERSLYKRKCDLCNKDMLSVYSGDKPFKVYCRECWYSDRWDPTEYGLEYDFRKSFFEQYQQLVKIVPHLNLMLTSVESSDYCNYSLYLKNCYLLFGSWDCENAAYSQRVVETRDSLDGLWLNQCELVYDSIYCTQGTNLKFAFDSHQCGDSAFLMHSRGCLSCFGCTNLRNKSRFFFNEQYSKEEYEDKVRSTDLGSYKAYQEVRARFEELTKRSIHPATHGRNNINSTGDFLRNCKNCKNCFLSNEGEDSKYCALIEKNFDSCYDTWIAMENIEECYEVIAAATNNQRTKFSAATYHNCSYLEYCYACVSSRNSFGCVSLKNKEHCLLNKQYSKESFEDLKTRIIEHMHSMPYADKKGRIYKYGEFFPPELSPFAYNETIAQEYFPLRQEEVESRGYSWKKPEEKHYQVTIKPDDLPDHIKDISLNVAQEIIGCAHAGTCNERCTTAFRIIPTELQLLRRMNLPLPRLCPNCRHYQRLRGYNLLRLWKRKCECAGVKSENNAYTNVSSHSHGSSRCPNEFETTYAPERQEIIYCEACYNSEVV